MKSARNVFVGIGIMAVPERTAMVEKLLRRLNLNMDAVSWDSNHEGHVANWWRAIELAGSENPSHILILEDDAVPCVDFLGAVHRIISRYPERTVSFFSASRDQPRRPAAMSLIQHNGFGDIAVVYPHHWLAELRTDFLSQELILKNTKWQAGYGADEVRMKLRPLEKTWVTSPNLVQHGAPASSTLGHKLAHTLSPSFIGLANSALALDWSEL